jgi:hypothetical protein
MKKLTSIALTLALPAVALPGLVSAGPPTDVTILHCGCTASGYNLELVELDINTNGAVGHEQHRRWEWETCTTIYGDEDYQRDRADCEVGTAGLTNLRECQSNDYFTFNNGYDCD